ncbi:MAG: 5-formyltetrahydrofolate cyclo-ligase [Coriobacteriia bacterium]|nr:5-formyltetrahydrofolate cyclo-ligase [Coriobacteriia bacterium]
MAHANDKSADAEAVAQAKRAARSRARLARDSVQQTERRSAAHELAFVLLELPELSSVATILAYAALPNELDPMPAIWRMRKRGVRIAYPRIEAPGVLGMHYVDHEMELVPGPFGLAQPSEHAGHAPHQCIDAVIVPGVAFDVQGTRLGYGGGYYDRLLPMMRPECVRIGVAFDEQVLEHIPTEDHDECVDIVVTPARIIRPDTPRRF